ncbi:MAG: NAD-dependent DNA ligase LigA, partial [Firmicutes bacterium]|nr:NAD-dependent DNA ligase LigA [Bacillota bacterium]
MEDIKSRIDRLTDELNYHSRKYYMEDSPEISDFEYDQKLAELARLEEEAPLFRRADSPTSRVGGQALKQFSQITHRLPVMSLDNSYDRNDLLDFDRRVRKGLEEEGLSSDTPVEYVLEPKIDGLSVVLQYEDGKLI